MRAPPGGDLQQWPGSRTRSPETSLGGGPEAAAFDELPPSLRGEHLGKPCPELGGKGAPALRHTAVRDL